MLLRSISVVILATSTAFSYLNGEYGTAVICGVCAGFVGGMVVAKQLMPGNP